MNRFSAYARPVPGGYWAMVRLPHQSKPNPVMAAKKKPMIYETELQATKEALRHMLRYFNGNLVRDGEIIKARSDAEQLFKPIYRKGRVIQVERAGE